MTNDDVPIGDPGTSQSNRLTGRANRMTGAAQQPHKTTSHRTKTESARKVRPVLLVGILKGLTPKTLTLDSSSGVPGRIVSVQGIDFRKAAGFDEAVRQAVANLGFTEANTAEVKSINSNRELLRAIRANGKRQTIYFGHSLGLSGLEPGGLDASPVDEKALGRAFATGAPRPIFVGCFSAETPLGGKQSSKGAIGLRQFLRLRQIGAFVREGG